MAKVRWLDRLFSQGAAERQQYIKQTADFYAGRPEVQRDEATMKLTEQELEDKLEAVNQLILQKMEAIEELQLQLSHEETNLGYYADRKVKLMAEWGARGHK